MVISLDSLTFKIFYVFYFYIIIKRWLIIPRERETIFFWWNLISYRNNTMKSLKFLLLGMISIIMGRITYNGAKFKRFFAIQKNQRIWKKRKSEKTFTTFTCILNNYATCYIHNDSFFCMILGKLFLENLSITYDKFCCLPGNMKSFTLILGR